MSSFHDRKANRMRAYNYSSPGAYFVTICVQRYYRKQNIFGIIQNGKIELNNNGMIANGCWASIPKHFPDSEIDEFVIMPDHIHGIIHIGHIVGAADLRSLQYDRSKMVLPKIIHGFKSSVSRKIHSTHFKWQKSYHDRIIRNHDELNRIRKYIIDNPINCDKHVENEGL